ncbi:MAG: protease modulator HflK [Pseudomonadota bacterium]
MTISGLIRRRRVTNKIAKDSVLNEASIAAGPLIELAKTAWQRILYVNLGLICIYAVSGFTIIDANQVGVVMRFGEITRSNDQPIVHEPGILFALPKPVDRVYKIEVDRVETMVLNELAPPSWSGSDLENADGQIDDSPIITTLFNRLDASIDPEAHGYVLTGDRNILHMQITARYRVSDPVRHAFYVSNSEDTLRSALLESSIKSAGSSKLDGLLGAGRDLFARMVLEDAQFRLNQVDVGLEIVSIELENLSPPEQVSDSFDAVQSAFIEAQTQTQDAKAYAAEIVPAAQAQAKQIIDQAQAAATHEISNATSIANSFMALLPSYSRHPTIVRSRIHRDAIERTLGQVARISFVPPPISDTYNGTRFRVLIPRLGNDRADDSTPEAIQDLTPANEESVSSASDAVLSRGEEGGTTSP